MDQEPTQSTVLEVARSLSIRCETALEFLEDRGFLGYGPDTPLPRAAVELLKREYRPSVSVKDRFLESVRRAVGGVSRAERQLRKLALALRRAAEDSPASIGDEAGHAGGAASRYTPPEAQGGQIESRATGYVEPSWTAQTVGSGRDIAQPESDQEIAVPSTGGNDDHVFDELDSLEQLLERISQRKQPAQETDAEVSFPVSEAEDAGASEEAPDDSKQPEASPEEFLEDALEAAEGEDPFTLLEKDIEEKTREEFLDESLKELEALLSELGNENGGGAAGAQPTQREVGRTDEAPSEEGPEFPDLDLTEVTAEEALPPFGKGDIRAPVGDEVETHLPAAEPIETGPSTEEEELVPQEVAFEQEGTEEPESLVSELLDLSALLEELPELDGETFKPEREPDERPAAEEEKKPSVVAQPIPGQESVRKWLRRSVVPYIRSVALSLRTAFGELAPLQKRVLAGFGLVMALAVLGGLGVNAWLHRPGGDIALWRSGQELLDAGRPAPARREFSKLIQRYPESPYLRRAMYLLGECLYQEESYGSALGTFSRVKNLLAARPREIDGLLYPDFTFRDQGELRIADCYVREGRFEEGIAVYEKVVKRDEHAPIAQTAALERAKAFLAWGEREGSPSAYRRAAQAFTLYRDKYPRAEDGSWVRWHTASAYLGLARTDREHFRDHLVSAAVELEAARSLDAEVSAWDPESKGQLSLDLANTYLELSQWPDAVAEYDRLLAGEPPPGILVRGKIGRAKALYEAGEFMAAFEGAKDAADEARVPDLRAEALFTKGDAAWELRRYDEMLASYEEALSMKGDENLSPGYGERAHMRITNVLFTQEGRFEEAAERYQRIVSRFPEGPYTHLALYRLGMSLFNLGRYEGAAAALKRSIHDYPQFEHRDPDLLLDAYYRTAECYMFMESWADAVTALKSALQDLGFPEDERGLKARVDLASCYAGLSLYDRAIEILENYLQRFPAGDPDGGISMQLGGYYRARFDFVSARRIHRRVAEEHRGEPVAADALFAEGKDLVAQAAVAAPGEREALRSAALLRFEQAIRTRPEDPEPVLEVARIYHSERDFAAARVYLGRYFELDPQGSEAGEARFLAGETAYNLGEYREAVGHFSRLDPSGLPEPVIAQASYEHGDAYRELGELERAEALFRDTARLFPSTEWGREARWRLDDLAWQEQLAKRPVQ
jgi:TolA-binding protein